MKNKKFIFIILGLVLIIILGATILTAQTSRIPAPRDVAGTLKAKRPIKYEKGKYGGTFIDALTGDPKSFNETQGFDAYTNKLIRWTSPYLFHLDVDTGKWNVFLGDHSKGKTGPGYDIDAFGDGHIEVTVYLRKDMYWNDGTRITADDFVYYHNEIICNDEIGHPVNPSTWIELESGDEVQTYFEKINRWTFKKVYPRTLGEPELSTNFNIMPKHIIKPVVDSKGPDGIMEFWGVDTPVEQLVSFGPWIIDSYDINQAVTLRRNDRYFFKDEWNNRLPYIDKYVLSIVSKDVVVLKFQNKELSLLSDDHFPQKQFKTIVEDAERNGYDVWNGGYESSSFFLVFNLDPTSERMKGTPQLKWFQDKTFRHAMNHLIDRETIALQAYAGLAEPANTLLTQASQYSDPSLNFDNSYSPDKAIKLLSEMGMRDRNGDGILEDKNNVEVGFELITYNDLDTTNKLVAILVKDWNANGIKATLTQVDFNTLMDITSNQKDWEATIYAIGFGLYPESVNVWPSDGNLHAWYPLQESPATAWEEDIDRLHDEARFEPDFETRKALWGEMYSVLYEQLPIIPLVRRYKFLAVYKEWGNVAWDFYADFGDNYAQKLYRK